MTEDMQKSHKALGKVLTILQEKGGCGKSSAIFNVSYYLSQNYKVLVIDLDARLQILLITSLETQSKTEIAYLQSLIACVKQV